MSTLALLVVLLLVLVGLLVVGGLAYLARRHPAWVQPLLVGLAGVTALAALITPVVAR
ncbi:hypothetical protein [Streptomyces sp. NBC_01334]|uniref:hypothetical protein n=1 Tax=Streptomyces sp. NBC_01334 TaxID=2903827 RepID=UPI002E0D5C13|nr:hypothetical protein OG736_46920 [Streptomyces sp. NBC_01334]